MDFSVTLGFAFLNFVYACLAIAGIGNWRKSPGVALIVTFLLIRTAFLTQLQTCEPRYVLVCFPALLALGAQSWRNRRAEKTNAVTCSTGPIERRPA